MCLRLALPLESGRRVPHALAQRLDLRVAALADLRQLAAVLLRAREAALRRPGGDAAVDRQLGFALALLAGAELANLLLRAAGLLELGRVRRGAGLAQRGVPPELAADLERLGRAA